MRMSTQQHITEGSFTVGTALIGGSWFIYVMEWLGANHHGILAITAIVGSICTIFGAGLAYNSYKLNQQIKKTEQKIKQAELKQVLSSKK